ncbi:MAG: thermonuclease family protein [Candidatus Schekmanbacteria bacterium]|nr:thermonuclease family protein [Candidatus Schekmanbacteria bacterium]
MFFTVNEIVDGDTFGVEPDWEWRQQKGERVRPTGYDTPEKGEPGYLAAKGKLERLILHKTVEIKEPKIIDRGRLVSDVYLNGKNLADYFPEYGK